MAVYYIVQFIYLMLPAYIANMIPPLLKGRLKPLGYALDFGKKFRGKRILGAHKTARGLIAAIIVAILVFYLQQLLYGVAFFKELSLVNYSSIGPMLGFLMGFGAMVGDALGSFIKRQLDIKPGKRLLFVDQLDFIVGALYFMAFVYHPGWNGMGIILGITFVLHIIVKHIGYYLGVNKEKW